MPSPTCEVRQDAGAYGATTSGVDITPGATVDIKLSSHAGVTSWTLSCITTDDTQVAAIINSGLTVDGVTKIGTFTMPATTGTALRFQSQVNGGIDANGREDTTYTTTLVLYTTVGGERVLAFEETTESSAFGWTDQVNTSIRTSGGLYDLAPEQKQTESQVNTRTPSDTPVLLLEYDTANDRTYAVKGYIVAQSADVAEYAYWNIDAFLLNDSGVLTIESATDVTEIANNTATPTLVLTANGDDIELTATGVAAVPIRWTGRLFVHETISVPDL